MSTTSTDTLKCPVCREALDEGQGACPRCGFKLIGKTQTFTPVHDDSVSEATSARRTTPALEVVKGPYQGERFVLDDGVFTLGRDPSCDIFLSNMTVSRHHATITVEKSQAKIADEGSLNGTWVDGKVVAESPLHPGSRVQIGTFDMVFAYLSE